MLALRKDSSSLEEKSKELEEKKLQSEKKQQTILQQKNLSLHNDMRKVMQFLMQETRRITAAEKEFQSKVAAVVTLKGELQYLFDTSRLERQKNFSALEEQGKLMSSVESQVRETSEFLRHDFKQITQEYERISQETVREQQALQGLKEEVAKQQSLVLELGALRSQLVELEHKLKVLQQEEQQLQSQKAETNRAVELGVALQLQCEAKRVELAQLQQQQLTQEAHLSHLEQSIQGRKTILQQVELDMIEAKKRLEMVRDQETHALQACDRHRQDQSDLRNEIARLHGVKSAAVELQQEALQLLQQQKESHEREIQLSEKIHQSHLAELATQFEQKKLSWEAEFLAWSQSQKDNFERELESMNKRDLDELRRRKRDFSQQVYEAMNTELSRGTFETTEQRSEHVRRQVDLIFDGFFDRVSRWKFW